MSRTLVAISALLTLGGIPLLAADSAATVTVAVNTVTHGSSATAGEKTAAVGTKIGDGEFVKTGVKSRAELQLANQSITRLGANTVFDYSTANNEIDLQAGTVLFSKPKGGAEMNIKTASVTAAIVGTTGFIQVHGKTVIFGLVEGTAQVVINGVTYTVGPGQFVRFTPGSQPQIESYNVPHFLETSPLMTSFNDKLPNQSYIDHEIAIYDSLVSQGFITPPTGSFTFTAPPGIFPPISPNTPDQQGQAHQFQNMPPFPTKPPQFITGLVENPHPPSGP